MKDTTLQHFHTLVSSLSTCGHILVDMETGRADGSNKWFAPAESNFDYLQTHKETLS